MAQTRTQTTEPDGARQGGGSVQDPDEIARRELIAWCNSHGLPVPPERTSAPADDETQR